MDTAVQGGVGLLLQRGSHYGGVHYCGSFCYLSLSQATPQYYSSLQRRLFHALMLATQMNCSCCARFHLTVPTLSSVLTTAQQCVSNYAVFVFCTATCSSSLYYPFFPERPCVLPDNLQLSRLRLEIANHLLHGPLCRCLIPLLYVVVLLSAVLVAAMLFCMVLSNSACLWAAPYHGARSPHPQPQQYVPGIRVCPSPVSSAPYPRSLFSTICVVP